MFTELLRYRRLRSLRRGVASGLIGIFVSALVSPVLAAEVTVPAGTKVSLDFAQSLDSRTAHKGDIVNLRVQQDVVVNGQTVIPKGAPATASVAEVKKGKMFGRKAEIKINNLRVRAADGRQIALSRYESGKRVDAKAPGAAAGGLILLGPIGLAAGAFIKGGHMVIKPGTEIDAVVQNDTPINIAAR
jgi:hypothetical protein